MDTNVSLKKTEVDPYSYILKLNTKRHNFSTPQIITDLSTSNKMNYDNDIREMKTKYGFTNDIYFYFVCPFWSENQSKQMNFSFALNKAPSGYQDEGT